MKKVYVFVTVFMLAVFGCFADKKATAKIETIVGKVSYEVSNEVWADLKEGMIIDVDSVISTGLNSTVTVLLDGKSVTVKPMKKGKLTDLASAGVLKSGVKIGSTLTSAEIADAAENSKKAVVTASSRASEAKTDLEWDE